MLGLLTSTMSALDAVFAVADRLEGKVNLYLWRIMK